MTLNTSPSKCLHTSSLCHNTPPQAPWCTSSLPHNRSPLSQQGTLLQAPKPYKGSLSELSCHTSPPVLGLLAPRGQIAHRFHLCDRALYSPPTKSIQSVLWLSWELQTHMAPFSSGLTAAAPWRPGHSQVNPATWLLPSSEEGHARWSLEELSWERWAMKWGSAPNLRLFPAIFNLSTLCNEPTLEADDLNYQSAWKVINYSLSPLHRNKYPFLYHFPLQKEYALHH